MRALACLFLFLQTVSVGLFVALDLILFFVFFDLSIVGMYFVIAGWGHGERARAAALKFFLYTFVGSLALLLGFIGLYLAADPHTFDLVELTRSNPLAGQGLYAGLVLLAVGAGLAVKTPTVPLHTWLPPAHTEAPAAGSAILAGVLLKMGTYGFVRIAMPLLPGSWRQYAPVFVVVGVVSVVYGALVALAQTDLKRMIAYTSVNHMGYVVLAIGAAGSLAGSDAQARSLAVTGAVVQMVSHGLLTGALFLLTGVLYDRGGTYALDAYSGLAAHTPRFAAATRGRRFRQPRHPRLLRIHRRVPDLHRQPGLPGHRDRHRAAGHPAERGAVPARPALPLPRPAPAARRHPPDRARRPPHPGGRRHLPAARPRAGHRRASAVPAGRGRTGRTLRDGTGGTVNQNVAALLPETFLAAAAVCGLLAGSWLPRNRQWAVAALAATACLAGIAATGHTMATGREQTVFDTTFAVDAPTNAGRLTVLTALLLVVAMSAESLRGHKRERASTTSCCC